MAYESSNLEILDKKRGCLTGKSGNADPNPPFDFTFKSVWRSRVNLRGFSNKTP